MISSNRAKALTCAVYRSAGGEDAAGPAAGTAAFQQYQTLNLKLMTSPSCTTYSFPSERSLPASRHLASLP